MSDGFVARLRTPLDQAADFSDVLADGWQIATASDLASRPVYLAADGTVPFGELFDIRGTGDGTIRLIGDLQRAARIGSGLTGGEVIIDGATGDETGARMRRGVIAVAQQTGMRAGLGAIAGSVIVFGAAGREPGLFSKRGSVVVLGTATPPPTYRYACTYHPPHLRLTLLRLRHRFGLAVADEHLDGTYERYSGDFAELGKGEILLWNAT